MPGKFDIQRLARGFQEANERAVGSSLIGLIGTPNGGSRLLASNFAIETHHRVNPVVDRSIARIAFLHRQLADPRNLNNLRLCPALQLRRAPNAVDVLPHPATPPRTL